MKHIMLGSPSLLVALAMAEVMQHEPERRSSPIKIPRSMRYYTSHTDMHPNDDWRGKGNKKRKLK